MYQNPLGILQDPLRFYMTLKVSTRSLYFKAIALEQILVKNLTKFGMISSIRGSFKISNNSLKCLESCKILQKLEEYPKVLVHFLIKILEVFFKIFLAYG